MNIAFVFLGGGLGALCRFGLLKAIGNAANKFPWATFTANVISSIIVGILMAYFLQKGENSKLYLLFITGFCGSFSTFSSFSYETYQLLQSEQYIIGISYILGSVIICLLSIALGMKMYNCLESI